jgi:L-ascorbate metabolism protein UlaG (beta-lactamase superfamily)
MKDMAADSGRKILRRRALLGGAGLAGAAGLAGYVYRAAPGFWQQYAREMGRPIISPPAFPEPHRWPDRGLFAAWLGHSTVLLKIDGFTILTDPVFSDRAGIHLGPVSFGVKRLIAPALEIPQLPRIDLILASHAHMDHFDLPSLRCLENPRTALVTASRTSDLLRVKKYAQVRELAWGQEARIGPVVCRAFEVNHWGARMRTDTYRGYNGYLIDSGRYRVLFAGDTAMTSFRRLKSSRQVDLAIMPIGAYHPWVRFHCTPEQAWQMGNEAGAEHFMPVHHQTFALGWEPRWEPIQRFYDCAGSRPERVAVGQIGEEFRLV